ncbi:T9SS type A sorting domain-containing protein [Hymenobacter sedentarius]|uniref:T9SS type A sorting domain-containing protein n=1 Tax=Hymenobacter sedentarius TaxID=1411621 RepID=UPI0012FD0BE7|nr:T9SS type A sorting domain-containing protein [Hymenobacter sedentarius]
MFDGAVTPAAKVTLDFVSPETVGQLQFISNVNATFSIDADRTLNINNIASGADFIIAAGSSLTVTNIGVAAAGAVMLLNAGATATIAGKLVFEGVNNVNAAHHLQGSGTNSIEFVSGSVFTGGQNFSGYAFGNSTALQNSVVFHNGSRYEQYSGSAPFALGQPSSVTTFEPASYYLFAPTGYTQAGFSGRTYGSFEYNIANTNTATISFPVTFTGNLIVAKGTIAINATGGVNIKGNVLVNGTSTLTFGPASATVVQFNGTTAQTIGGTAGAAALTLGDFAQVTIDNPAGVVLQRPITLKNQLTLANGKVTTDATNLLTLSSTALLSGGNDNSFVNGPLARVIGVVSTNTDFLMPIGKGNAYRPLTFRLTQTAESTYTAEQMEGSPGGAMSGFSLINLTPLKRVSRVRWYRLTSSNQANSNTSGKITLSFGPDDGVNDPTDPGFVVASRSSISSNSWINLTNTADTGSPSSPFGSFVSGTVSSKFFDVLTSPADFALGSTSSNTNLGTAINPLPVELTSFTARRQANAVAVRWATASEKNSAYFELQRSLTGSEFVTVGKVEAHGNSTVPNTYAFHDEKAPVGVLYYRLRQVDNDGKVAFSPIVTVSSPGVSTEVVLYPNPAKSLVSFMATTTTPYHVLNQVGQVQMRGIAEAGTAVVEVSKLLPGVYLLELQTAQGRVVRKFIKE